MVVLIDRCDQSQLRAFFDRDELNDIHSSTTSYLTVIKETGKHTRAYNDWLTKPDADKTYANLKAYWRLEHLKIKRTNPTSKQYDYGMSMTDTTHETSQPNMATILKQCANAPMERQHQQQEYQKQFKSTMAANMAAIQEQMNSTAIQQQNMMNAAVQQYQMQQAMQQQQANMTNTATISGATGGNWQKQAWQTMQQQGTQVCHPAFTMQNNQTQSKIEKTPFRIFEN